MIKSSNTVNIDGTKLNDFNIREALSFDRNDKFSFWVVRPLAILTAAGLGVGMFFASAFLIAVLLAMVPLLALSMWAMKTKHERAAREADPVVASQVPSEPEDDIDADLQTAR